MLDGGTLTCSGNCQPLSECEFWAIIADPSAARTVSEDDQTLAFLDIEPATRGHTLVVPKRHDEELTEINESTVGVLFQTVNRVAGALESAVEPDGISVVQSNGAAGGREIPHVHVHVIPRDEDDNVNLRWDPQAVTESTQAAIAERLREEVDALR